ncbi:TonB family protein [Phenylobacterium immobile]|uniref:TonB family protein n=1 Tax=Phenylobacterium immobile TaxID=21 RepID=UPI000AC5E8BD|nr:TonB family protein [Phenylobacterium immobile]
MKVLDEGLVRLVALITTSVLFAGSHPPSAVAQFRYNYRTVPSRGSIDAVWPIEARRAGLTGSAAMVCDIERDKPANCKIISEHPAGQGFGDGLLRLGVVMSLWPMTPRGCMAYFNHMVFSVDWPLNPEAPRATRWPNEREMGAAFPAAAWKAQQKGEAVLDCAVSESGALADCRIAHEAPEGYGFGAALLSLTPKMVLQPAKPGAALPKRMVVPMNFVPTIGPSLNCRR